MKDDDFLYNQFNNEHYMRVTCVDGVRTTLCENRFEIVVQPQGEVPEQQTVQALREWIRNRQKKLRDAGDLPG